MPFWSDLYKLWNGAFRADPLSELENTRNIQGAGVTAPEGIPDIRGGQNGFNDGGNFSIRGSSNDFIDLSSVSNRQARYKEYDRLRSVAEIEMALTVFADETCVAGHTKIATPFGYITIKELAEQKKPGERFMVYTYDFKKKDWTIGWGHTPRMTKTAPTVRVCFDDGSDAICTPDHRVLLRTGEWKQAGELRNGEELMPFYRVRPNQDMTQIKTNQFPRIYSFVDGWKHERQMIDEWRAGKKLSRYERVNKIIRVLSSGVSMKEAQKIMHHDRGLMAKWLEKEGFSNKEIVYLSTLPDRRRVVGVFAHDTIPVYDLSVEEHQNFASDSICFHNCQVGENGHMFDIKAKDRGVKEEAEFLLHEVLDIEENLWSDVKNLCLLGDTFWEIILNEQNPKAGIMKLQRLPADSMYRIETIKGKLMEFQQSKEGPDYQSLARVEVTKATDADLLQATALRFTPEQIIHMKIGDDRKTFYPYGVSLIEAARGPAHQLRLMEDAMLVYRLTRAPERRVFYIDVGQLPQARAEAYLDRMKDQFRKKKVATGKGGGVGASAVEERWHAPSQEEDYWLPLRPNTNTRIETLPGAQNLGEIDDAIYFRNKLFVALNFPKNYAGQEDPQQTRITLSSQDVKFARMIERIQKSIARGIRTLITRHLQLLGYPEERIHDLAVHMTPPSDWREISRNEVVEARFNRAATLKGSQLMSDYDILVDILKFDPERAKEYVARMKQQKLEDLKIQVMAANPQLLGLGQPPNDETELGIDSNGPNSQIAPTNQQPPQNAGGGENAGQEEAPPPPGAEGEPTSEEPEQGPPQGHSAGKAKQEPMGIPEPDEGDIDKYDLQLRDYSREIDEEEVDTGELGE